METLFLLLFSETSFTSSFEHFDVQWKIVVYLLNNHFLSHTHICRGPDVEHELVDENWTY